jgi:hypothetical protein
MPHHCRDNPDLAEVLAAAIGRESDGADFPYPSASYWSKQLDVTKKAPQPPQPPPPPLLSSTATTLVVVVVALTVAFGLAGDRFKAASMVFLAVCTWALDPWAVITKRLEERVKKEGLAMFTPDNIDEMAVAAGVRCSSLSCSQHPLAATWRRCGGGCTVRMFEGKTKSKRIHLCVRLLAGSEYVCDPMACLSFRLIL